MLEALRPYVLAIKIIVVLMFVGPWLYAWLKSRSLRRRERMAQAHLNRDRFLSETQKERKQVKKISASLNLDASHFKPLSHTAAATLINAAGMTGSRFWGLRRDRIPPADHLASHLVERSMVAEGFISSERLAEMHNMGRKMDALEAQFEQARQKARVAADTEPERKALKAQKKEEARLRREQHAKDVQHRRDTDIVFLGRGVSKELHDRRSNIEKLRSLSLPILATPADVSAFFELSIPKLRWLAFHSSAATVSHYIRFSIPKKSGGTRELAAPHKILATAQNIILRRILDKIPCGQNAHGFVAGKSTVSNATPHTGAKVLVNCDLKDFFPSIHFPRVRGLFKSLGYSPAVSTILALICTESPRRTVEYAGKQFHVATGPRALPQGACTSPALSNLIARSLDARLHGIAQKTGWTYTRYADDLSFSTTTEDGAALTAYLLARVRHIVQDENFAVNEKKTRVLRQNTAQMVTGIVVNEKPNVPRDLVRRIRAILHRARFEGLEAQNVDANPHFEAWLKGMLAYITMVNPDKGQTLARELESLPK